jgi:hypothetical protein
MQEATSSIVVESTMWMVARKRWSGPLERLEPANPGEKGLEMPEHGPEELLGQRGAAVFSRVGKAVAARGRGAADGRERAAVNPEGVADIVESDGVAELGIEHGNDMAPCREGAAEFIDAGVPGQLGNEVGGNEVAKLPKAAEFRGGWTGCLCSFHPCRVAGSNAPVHPLGLCGSFSMGRLCSQIDDLELIRRGSITEQFVDAVLKDGTKVRRGPYTLHSFKDNDGRTVSRRLTDPAQIASYRSQIEAFRQFQQCTAELLTLGEALCDLAIDDPEAQKKTPNSKARNRTKSKP